MQSHEAEKSKQT